MVTFNKHAFSTVLLASFMSSETLAFTPVSNISTSKRTISVQRMVATTPADIGVGNNMPSFDQNSNTDNENKRNGAMMDLEGIAFSVSLLLRSHCKPYQYIHAICKISFD